MRKGFKTGAFNRYTPPALILRYFFNDERVIMPVLLTARLAH